MFFYLPFFIFAAAILLAFRLHEKGGKRHEVPAHHNAMAYADEYVEAAGIAEEKRLPLFRTLDRRRRLTDRRMHRSDILRMVKRRARDRGRPNPASKGRLKTGHLEEEKGRQLGSTLVFWLKEEPDGEPTRNGESQCDSEVTRTRLVVSPNRSRTGCAPRGTAQYSRLQDCRESPCSSSSPPRGSRCFL